MSFFFIFLEKKSALDRCIVSQSVGFVRCVSCALTSCINERYDCVSSHRQCSVGLVRLCLPTVSHMQCRRVACLTVTSLYSHSTTVSLYRVALTVLLTVTSSAVCLSYGHAVSYDRVSLPHRSHSPLTEQCLSIVSAAVCLPALSQSSHSNVICSVSLVDRVALDALDRR